MDAAIFTLTSPLLGIDEAIRLVGREFPRSSIGRDLVRSARHYEQSGVSYEAYFEFLFNQLSLRLDDWTRLHGEVDLSILMVAVSIAIVEAISIFLVGIGPASAILITLPIPLILVIHVNQVELFKYDYVKPAILALAACALAYMVSRNYIYCLMAASMGFSTLFIPQFANYLKTMLNLRARVLEPILELMWNPSPRPIRPITVVEREVARIWDVAYSVGAPYFVSRAARVVDLLISHIVQAVRYDFIYGSLALASYLIVATFLTYLARHLPLTISMFPLVGFQIEGWFIALSSLMISILAGKAMNSIGFGVVLIAPTLALATLL